MACLSASACGQAPAQPTAAPTANLATAAATAEPDPRVEARVADARDAETSERWVGAPAPWPPPERVVHPRYERPDWLFQRPLTDVPGERVFGVETPAELRDRQLATPDRLPPPPDDTYRATVEPLSDEVLARTTWNEGCPVARDELAHVVVTHWGFDGLVHTGELVVHADVAEDVAWVFGELHAARFPIEEMGFTAPKDLQVLPTGDGNGTGAFACRAIVGSSGWSQHAYGLAIDINPFHNPYEKGEWVVPELAGTYTDRDDVRRGMITADGPVVAAFEAIGWHWGGRWNSAKDWMHFSQSGR